MPPLMTKLPGVKDSGDVRPGMAYFAGSGPPGVTCGSCLHKGYPHADYARNKLGCAMFYRLTGKHGPVINGSWSACKYYEERPKE